MSLLAKFLKWLSGPSGSNMMPENHIDAICNNCGRMTEHEIIRVFTYRCLKCGSEQPKDEALTREETSW